MRSTSDDTDVSSKGVHVGAPIPQPRSECSVSTGQEANTTGSVKTGGIIPVTSLGTGTGYDICVGSLYVHYRCLDCGWGDADDYLAAFVVDCQSYRYCRYSSIAESKDCNCRNLVAHDHYDAGVGRVWGHPQHTHTVSPRAQDHGCSSRQERSDFRRRCTAYQWVQVSIFIPWTPTAAKASPPAGHYDGIIGLAGVIIRYESPAILN